MSTKKHKHFTAEFKQDAVNYYHTSGKSMAEVASDLQISPGSLNNWIQKAKALGKDYSLEDDYENNYNKRK